MVSLERKTPASLADALAAALRAHSPAAASPTDPLAKVIQESIENPGRLTRARVAFLASKSLGVPAAATEKIACAVEYFHIASLILDDLPCMDNAAVRRGLPCAHRKYGESAAILGALALINKAYSLIGSATAAIPSRHGEAVSRCVERCLGISGLVGGQALDLAFARTTQSPRDIGRAAIGKTVPMLRLALELPAIAGLASAREITELRRLAVYWGLLYQCADDFADVGLGAEPTGKTGGRDAALGRPNMVTRTGVERARSRMARWSAQAGAAATRLSRMNPAWAFLRPIHASMPSAHAGVPGAEPVAAA